MFTLYEVKLGKIGQENATCNLWSGNVIVDKARYSAGQVIGADAGVSDHSSLLVQKS